MSQVKINALAPVGNLFLTVESTESAKVLGELLDLLERRPEILKRVEADQDKAAREAKKVRMEERQWQAARTPALPGLPVAGDEIDADQLRLGDGRPRLPPDATCVFLVMRGEYGSVTDRGAVERLLDALAPALRSLAMLVLRRADEQETAIALTRKELRSVLRDPSVHLVLFFALLFIALPGLMFSARAPLLGIQVTWFLTMATVLTLNAVLAVSSIGREGLGLSLIAHLPVRTETLLFAKACAALLLHAVLSLGLAAGVLLLPLDPVVRIVGALATWLLSAASGVALSFLAVGLGAIFPRFDAKNQFLAINRFGVAVFFGLATLLAGSMVGAAAYPAIFGVLWLPVPLGLLGLWGYVAGVVYLEGSRRRGEARAELAQRLARLALAPDQNFLLHRPAELPGAAGTVRAFWEERRPLLHPGLQGQNTIAALAWSGNPDHP